MKKVMMFMAALAMLLSCKSKDDEMNRPLNMPPYTPCYSAFLSFADAHGNDLSDRVEREEAIYSGQHKSESGVWSETCYRVPRNEYTLRCFINGQEFEHYDTSYSPPIEVKIYLLEHSDEPLRYFELYFGYWMDVREYIANELHEFEYRFTIPAIFGDEENVLKITAGPYDFAYFDIAGATFNGEEIKENKYLRGYTGCHFFSLTVEDDADEL